MGSLTYPASLNDDEVEVEGQSVTFALLGKSPPTTFTFTYTVTASSEEGEHSFTGVFSGVDTNFDSFSDIQVRRRSQHNGWYRD